MVNFIQAFQEIVGPYSLTAIRVDPVNGSWTCSIYRGGKRIGTAGQAIDDLGNKRMPTYLIPSEKEELLLAEHIDRAGPMGFETIEGFLVTVIEWVELFKKMRKAAQKNFMVVVDSEKLDCHDMPTEFKATHTPVNKAWIKAYAKHNPAKIVVNDQVR